MTHALKKREKDSRGDWLQDEPDVCVSGHRLQSNGLNYNQGQRDKYVSNECTSRKSQQKNKNYFKIMKTMKLWKQ